MSTFVTISCQANDADGQPPFVLDVPDASKTPGTAVQQFRRNGSHGSFNQQWCVFTQSFGEVSTLGQCIVARYSGQSLTAKGSTDHSAVTVELFAADPSRQWFPLSLDGSSKVLFSALGGNGAVLGGPVLDLPLPEGRNHQKPLQISRQNGGHNQNWIFNVAEEINTYAFVNRHHRLVMDVPSFSTADDTVNQYSYNGGPNQMWSFATLEEAPLLLPSDGQFCIIRSISSGKVLQIAANGGDGSVVVQSDYHHQPNQQWVCLRRGRNGSFFFLNRQNNLFLSTSGTSVGGDPLVVGFLEHGGTSANQEWFPRSMTHPYIVGLTNF
jgi:Ricin-type beta-trefoil lectin domain-like